MEEKRFLAASSKFSIMERKTQRYGTTYIASFRVYDPDTGDEVQKRISGKTKSEVKYLHDKFLSDSCDIVRNACKIAEEKRNGAKAKIAPTTFEEAMDVYFGSCNNQMKNSSIVTQESRIRLHVLPFFSGKNISEITSKDIWAWQDEMWAKKRPNGAYYSSEYLLAVRGGFYTFMNWFSARNDFQNPFKGVKRPKRRMKKTRMSFWTREQFDQFISVVEDKTFRTLFYTLFYTGRRLGEVIALSPKDVERSSIRFNKTYTAKTLSDSYYDITTTKAEKDGATPICPTLKKILSEYHPEPGAAFYFGGERPVPENTIRNRFKKYISDSEVPPIRVHDLRHSFVSMLIHEGGNMMVVADLIGDTVEQVMKTYGHLYQEDKLAIISKL